MTYLPTLLERIVQSDTLHAKWLNTLSYLENCGARKIAACEHPTQVKEEMLKHAAEEFRHAHYLKRQIAKITSSSFNDYSPHNLLGGFYSLHYLHSLDLFTSRYLSQGIGLPKSKVKENAYLLVTYAIEVRAQELYAIYDAVLRNMHSEVFVKSIVLEEKEHLNEMKEGLQRMRSGIEHAHIICDFEHTLYKRWISAIEKECN